MSAFREHILIIAEAGVNHNGSLDLALQLVDAAAACGADAVKFQTFRADSLVARDAPKARYQQETTGTAEGQFAMLQRLELDMAAHRLLSERCQERGLVFLSSPFDIESARALYELGMRRYKIPSGEITNMPLLECIGRLAEEVLLSTGMADVQEVGEALAVLDEAGLDRSRVTVLHCTTEYPAPYDEVNLRSMMTMGKKFGVRTGYSDHTPGIEIPVAAAALGAWVLEKHFTLDKSLPGPDHRASLDPTEFAAMVRAVRHVELALGDGVKRPTASELPNRIVARKSIVAARPIRTGEIFSTENLTAKRPGSGVSPMRWHELLGRPARRSYQPDDMIDPP
ncbi:MAG: N-acetylneuraminate synthase [Desulfobulbaceae bacterium A2]|nr:MAG: N-acetylneuraminate synthase [Desulfobulbaceae bacterium A2]